MPGGPTPLGFAYFVGVKLVGYTIAGLALGKGYPQATSNAWKVGATRTAIGLGAGLAYGALWIYVTPRMAEWGDWSFSLYFAGLLPIRVAEWAWLLHLLFDRGLKDKRKAIRSIGGGIAWSYCLDAIGFFATFVIPGGAWVC